MASSSVTIEVGGRSVKVSSADRVVFPESADSPAITKLDVVQYYTAVGEAMLHALRERPTTLERWPKGVFDQAVMSTRQDNSGDAFYQKRIPAGAPRWVQTARITFPSGRSADEVCPTEPAVFAWAAQMGTITFHPWPVRRADVEHPDELRIDLDPQPGTDVRDATEVAIEARTLLTELGMAGFPKTSGGRGIHIYIPIEPRWTFTEVRYAAIAFGRELARRMPGRVTTEWWKERRGETVFVDYNQNARDRTIAGAYSLRARPGAPASTPLTWDEVADVEPSGHTLHTVPGRLREIGDPMAGIGEVHYSLDTLLQMYASDAEEGLGDMPYPPDHPKMPGEPMRVQPSRARGPEQRDNAR